MTFVACGSDGIDHGKYCLGLFIRLFTVVSALDLIWDGPRKHSLKIYCGPLSARQGADGPITVRYRFIKNAGWGSVITAKKKPFWSDLGLRCLLRPVCQIIYGSYGIYVDDVVSHGTLYLYKSKPKKCLSSWKESKSWWRNHHEKGAKTPSSETSSGRV